MRIAFVAVVGMFAVTPVGVANAARLIETPMVAPAAPAAVDSALCLTADGGNGACAAPAGQAASTGPRDNESMPPAAVAGIVGLLVLGMAFRPRKPAHKLGLPEVTS